MKRILIIASFALYSCIDADLSDELNWNDGLKDSGITNDSDMSSTDSSQPDSSDGSLDSSREADPLIPDTTPPAIVEALACAVTEQMVGPLCVSAGPFGISVRFWASEPVKASVEAEPSGIKVEANNLTSTHHFILAPLPPETEQNLSITIVDVADLETTEGPHSASTTQAVSPVAINEVLFDPLGSEPHQEFIELFNYGEHEIPVEGWTISDEGGTDTITEPIIIPSGGYALIVSDQFVPGGGGDVPPAEDVVMIVLDGPIGSAGMRNAGEMLSLKDALGNQISTFPALAVPSGPGISIERYRSLGPDGDPLNWGANPASLATPGSVNQY